VDLVLFCGLQPGRRLGQGRQRRVVVFDVVEERLQGGGVALDDGLLEGIPEGFGNDALGDGLPGEYVHYVQCVSTGYNPSPIPLTTYHLRL